MSGKKELSNTEISELLKKLQERFERNKRRHEGIDWAMVQTKLEANPTKLRSLDEMEITGGEPDVVGYDQATNTYLFFDCSAESPKGRRSLCYNRSGLESRKEHKPKNSALDMATEMGIELLNEAQYKQLQMLGEFDNKTSSWLKTPDAQLKLGGAIFGDFRFGRVFIYHNGIQSYYGSRGFRGVLKV